MGNLLNGNREWKRKISRDGAVKSHDLPDS
jgi:hypothetical protein